MNTHPIEMLMKTTMESIKEMVDVNTIVGDPVETPEGTVIVPISKVSFGFASGGGDFTNEIKKHKHEDENELEIKPPDQFPFAGGTGAGVSVQPVAFMVVGNGQMKLMPVDQKSNMIDNILSMTPKVMTGLQSMMNNSKNKNTENINNNGQNI
ncbi:GerW family sporulation protein [Serpentinicella sp. ANB-PHB4]|uniref:GerW family sporulation protein n=1 Tax=Serpentinicella sp. ANB-PHB4 TaxID=3074076 RepID=UPI00285E7C32|nr:GerW family sporulation protein [Serpentinicella sp. ANB-PHB4]MDR5658159.1 GerW family sporulation protein [Serpentinicella sp. ANB-PHB4]